MDEVKYTNAYADWDDREQAFVVYLEDSDESREEPIQAEYSGNSIDARLHMAAFCAHPKDFANLEMHRGALTFPKKTQAARAAKAIKKELKRIEKGEPGPDRETIAWAVQIARVYTRKR